MNARAAPLLVAAIAWAAACSTATSTTVAAAAATTATTATTTATTPTTGAPAFSNVLRADYAGSDACLGCHAAIAETWTTSPMHRMTRVVESADIAAPFDGATFSFKGDSATAEMRDGKRVLHIRSVKDGDVAWQITKVIGGRHREDFAGVPLGSDGVDEKVLPVSYLRFADRWRYKGYSVMVTERPGLAAGPVWRDTCILCHNEAPYFITIYNALESAQSPSAHTVYQGSVSDGFLPAERRWSVAVDDERGVAGALADEAVQLGFSPTATAAPTLAASAGRAAVATRKRFDASHLVEVGIGCETCHNGSKRHADSRGAQPTSLLPRSPLFHVTAPAGVAAISPAQTINHVCNRCHTVLFSQYPYTWEGGRRDSNPGGSAINSGEARDFLLGGCASALSCVRCHDPHGEDSAEKLDGLAGPAGNALCLSCHERISVGGDVSAHTHHSTHSTGSSCLGCHMPKKNAGLAQKLTRYHRIGAPTDVDRVERDRPLECALCHVDKSVTSLVDSMESWWGKRYDRASLRALYGDDLSVNALVATIARGKPHEQIAAAGALAELNDDVTAGAMAKDALPALVRALPHRYPLARPYLKAAIERVAGAPMDVDVDLDAAVLAEAANRWLAARVSRDALGGRAAQTDREAP